MKLGVWARRRREAPVAFGRSGRYRRGLGGLTRDDTDPVQLKHELYNRAAVVSGFAALIAEEVGDAPPEVIRQHVEYLVDSAGHMGGLVEQWPSTARPSEGGGGQALVQARVLVVEDDDDQFHLIRSLLSRPGYLSRWSVSRAMSLAAAVGVTAADAPDCTVLDLGPQRPGDLDVLAHLRSVAPDQAVVVVTDGVDDARGVAALRLGAQDFVARPALTRELLERTLQHAMERNRAEAELEHRSLHDAMTGLANRTLLFDRLSLACARLERHPSLLGVVFVDLDRFKIVNDSLGHRTGDEILVEVADRLRSRVRQVDTVARVGGDEFVIILEDLNDEMDLGRLADHLLDVFHQPFETGEGVHGLTASVGVALARSPGVSPEVLVANADTAMYRAKERGGDRWELFDDDMRTRLVTRFETERELAGAIERRELVLWYQPIIDAYTGRVQGTEALLRWQHPTRGLLVPAEFLHVAEESGQMPAIGQWVLDEACSQAYRWERAGMVDDGFVMWVNVSSHQIERASLNDAVMHALGLDSPSWTLGLEITESALIQDLGLAKTTLEGLRAQGVRVAIDDFGTGFSCLKWLHALPIEHLKIDSSFVAGMVDDSANLAIVTGCLRLGDALGIPCTAEGVETEGQLQVLNSLRCHSAQGYLFSPPVPPVAAEEVLRKSCLLPGGPRPEQQTIDLRWAVAPHAPKQG